MKDSTTFINLVNEVLEKRREGKTNKDIAFLNKVFTLEEIKDKYKTRIKYLGRIYSVARTLNPDLGDDDWEELFSKKNVKKYEIYEEKAIGEKSSNFVIFLVDLINFLKTENINSIALGSHDNCIVSALSKYGYYHTKANFPIYDIYAEKYIKLLFKKLCPEYQVELNEQNEERRKDKYFCHFFRYAMILKYLNNAKITKFTEGTSLINGIDSFVWMYGVMENAMKDSLKTNAEGILCYSQTCGDVSEFVPWYKNAMAFLGLEDKE